MAIRVITFDLDETLWPLQPTLTNADRASTSWLTERVPAFEELITSGAITQIRDRVLAEDREIRSNVSLLRRRILTLALLHLGLDSDQADEFTRGAFEVFLRERQRVVLFEGMKDVLERLSKRFALGALTNGNADLHRAYVDHPFSFVHTTETVGRGKPYPDMFLAALESSKAKASEAIHVGDSLSMDILPALAVGMHALWANFAGNDKPPDYSVEFEARSVEEIEPCIERIVARA